MPEEPVETMVEPVEVVQSSNALSFALSGDETASNVHTPNNNQKSISDSNYPSMPDLNSPLARSNLDSSIGGLAGAGLPSSIGTTPVGMSFPPYGFPSAYPPSSYGEKVNTVLFFYLILLSIGISILFN